MKQMLTVLIIGLFSSAFAQDTPPLIAEENPDLAAQVDYILENLDMSSVTTNLLLDRGFKMNDISNYTGAAGSDTLHNFDDWAATYMSLYTSSISSTNPLGQLNNWTTLAEQQMANGIIPIMALYAGYHQFLEDSVLLSTCIMEIDGQLYDTWSGSNSPYIYREAFVSGPYKSKVYDALTHTFRFQTQFYITNRNNTIASVQINFDNGQGFQTVTSGVNKTVSWPSHGIKTITTRITYTNATVNESKARFELVDRYAGEVPSSLAKYNSIHDDSIYVAHPSLPNHGVSMMIEYGCNHDALVKPFIYVEGFNPKEFEDSELNFRKFMSNLFEYQFDNNESYQLLTELQNNGYDIVYIDFEQGSGDLTYNATALAEAIKEINALKTSNGSAEQNVLVGESMGGLVARLAMTYLEDAQIDPQVNYYVSLDAPHLGAHIPEAFKWCFQDLYSYRFSFVQIASLFESMRNANAVFNSPAARQMLRYGTDYSAFQSLQNHLTTQDMPTTTIQNIAIANGNGSGTNQGFGTMAPMLDVDLSTFNALSTFTDTSPFWSWMAGLGAAAGFGTVGRIQLDLNAQPGTVGNFLEIYRRKIRARVLWVFSSWSSYSVKVANRIPLDGSPGGAYDLNDIESGKILMEDFYGPGDHLYYSLPELVETWEPAIELHLSKFSFVPTASALNLPSLFPTPFVPIDPVGVVSNNLTTFHKVHILDPTLYPSTQTAPTNESHLAYTPSSIGPFEVIISPGVQINLSTINTTGQVVNYGSNTTGTTVVATSKFIKNLVTIGSSQDATLCVNCSGPIGNSLNSGNPNSNSVDFTVRLTRNCFGTPGRLRVQSQGSLLIGQSSSKTGTLIVEQNSWIELNDGIIEIREGSKLIIESGAELRLNGGQVKVYDGGEIIIKEGGLLIYEDGVVLQLNGNDAQLALGGLTHIGDNATFRFFWQGSESGYVRLLKEGHWGQRFSAGTNARIHLQGNGKTDQILYMEKDADLWEYIPGENIPNQSFTSNYLNRIRLSSGKIEMEQGARIVVLDHGQLSSVHLEPVGNQVPRGVECLHFCDVSGSDFHKVKLTANMHIVQPGLNSGRLSVQSSTFNEAPVKIRGRYFNIAQSDFMNSPIDAEQGNALSRISLSNFNESMVLDNSPSELLVFRSNFEGWLFQGTGMGIGVAKRGGRLTLKCNDFINLSYAVDGWNMASLNLSTLHGGGYNFFQGNKFNIHFEGISQLILERGYNEFNAGSVKNIFGLIAFTSAFSCFPLDATLNIWAQQALDPNQNHIWVENGGTQVCNVNLNYGDPNEAQVASCGEHDPPEREHMEKSGLAKNGTTAYPLITTDNYFDATPYDVAVQLAAVQSTLVDSLNGDNLVSAAMYHELLEVDLDFVEDDSLAAGVERMSWQALHAYKGIIELLLADSVLSQESNQITFEDATQAYANTLMAFTDSVKTPENYGAQFDLELMKTSLFLSLNKPDIAYSILANMDYCDHDSLERAVLTSLMEHIAYDIYASELGSTFHLSNGGSFELDSAILANLTYSAVDISTFGTYIVDPQYVWFSNCDEWSAPKNQKGGSNLKAQFNFFPNPTSSTMNVEIYRSDMPADLNYEFRLYDLQGKLMLATQLQQNWQQVSLPKLPSALYLGAVYSEGLPVYQQKVNIMH